MAIDTRTNLRSALTSWLEQDDVTDRLDDFIALAEARFNRELRVREMDTSTSGSVSTATLAMPSDFLELNAFRLTVTPPITLEYRPPDEFYQLNAQSGGGQPRLFTILGTDFRLAPAPDSAYTYTLEYKQQIPALTASNETNWLLTKAPDLYLYGSLLESAPFLQDDARITFWSNLYQASLKSLIAQDARSRYRPGTRMRASNNGYYEGRRSYP